MEKRVLSPFLWHASSYVSIHIISMRCSRDSNASSVYATIADRFSAFFSKHFCNMQNLRCIRCVTARNHIDNAHFSGTVDCAIAKKKSLQYVQKLFCAFRVVIYVFSMCMKVLRNCEQSPLSLMFLLNSLAPLSGKRSFRSARSLLRSWWRCSEIFMVSLGWWFLDGSPSSYNLMAYCREENDIADHM